jgi:4-hydroxy-3-polyprenylbenzoate decarboxylase
MTNSLEPNPLDLVVAITGASGAAYAARLLQVLVNAGRRVHVTVSPSATQVFQLELGLTLDLRNCDLSQLLTEQSASNNEQPRGSLVYHHYQDFRAGIASGSFLTAGMVVCPCSMGTLASIANGLSTNLIHRAADVHLKERRKLILVPRETPLGSIQLENMKRLADVGAIILPAMPGFYHGPTTIQDLVDFVVGRICDQLGVPHELFKRWGSN